MKERGSKNILKILIVLLIAAAAVYGGYRILHLRSSAEKADQVLEVMMTSVPGLGSETYSKSGTGRDPLAAMSINDMDIVGCIELPSIDVMAPVTAEGYDAAGFASVYEGSPVRGGFMLSGSRKDVFSDLARLQPGDTAVFTDIDGIRYNYRVTTQFHLKDWDEAEYDLMLCYRTDDDTMFVVACTAGE